MGNRLSKIYTRTGDDGTTGLGDGTRTDKDSLRVEAYGTVDEANSAIGVVLAETTVPKDVRACLTDVQHVRLELSVLVVAEPAAEELVNVEEAEVRDGVAFQSLTLAVHPDLVDSQTDHRCRVVARSTY